MREYKRFMVSTAMPVRVTCNMCGTLFDSEEDAIEEWQSDTIHEFKVDYSYGSDRDGTTLKWDLCESCLEKIYTMFKLFPEIKERYF